jgi:hypothetical protein
MPEPNRILEDAHWSGLELHGRCNHSTGLDMVGQPIGRMGHEDILGSV